MIQNEIVAGLGYVGLLLLHLTFVARAILRPHREPASRVAWVVVIVILPLVGIIGYILLGETNIGRRRIARVLAANLLPSGSHELLVQRVTRQATVLPGDVHRLGFGCGE